MMMMIIMMIIMMMKEYGNNRTLILSKHECRRLIPKSNTYPVFEVDLGVTKMKKNKSVIIPS